MGGDASEGEGQGGIKVGESERKKGRVSEVSVATERGASAHDIGQNNGPPYLAPSASLDLASVPTGQFSAYYLPFAKMSFPFV